MKTNKKIPRKSSIIKIILFITIIAVGVLFAKYPLQSSDRIYIQGDKLKYQLIETDSIIEQSFTIATDYFSGYDLPIIVENSENSKGQIKLELYNFNNSLIASKNYKLKELNKKDYLSLTFNKINDSKYKQYKIILKNKNFNGNEEIKVPINKLKYGNSTLVVDNNEVSKYSFDMLISGNKNNYYLVYISILVLFLTSFKFFKNHIKKVLNLPIIKSINKIKYKDFLLCFIELLICIGIVLITYRIIININYCHYFSVLKLLIIYILEIALALIISLNLYNDKKIKWEKLFLLVAIPIGMFYLAFLIPNRSPDEFAHYVRAYKVSNGIFIDNKNKVDISTDILKINDDISNYADLNSYIKQKTDYNKIGMTTGPEGYISLMYLFSGTGVFIGKILGLTYYQGYYLARLLNFIFFLLMGYLSIKTIPKFKIFTFIFLLNPMMLQQCTSVSADMVLNVISVLFISYVFKLYYQNEKINNKNIYLLTILGIIVSISKYMYFPLTLFSLILIPKLKKQKDKKLFVYLLSIIIPFITGVGWYLFATYGIKGYSKPEGYYAIANINFIKQINYVLANPMQYLTTLGDSFNLLNDSLIIQTFGGVLGRLDIGIPRLITFVYMMLLLMSIFIDKDKDKEKGSIYIKIYTVLLFVLFWNLIFFGMYTSFTEVKGTIVLGVQGRYFIPVIMILLTLVPNSINLTIKHKEKLISLMIIAVHFIVISTIISYFV